MRLLINKTLGMHLNQELERFVGPESHLMAQRDMALNLINEMLLVNLGIFKWMGWVKNEEAA